MTGRTAKRRLLAELVADADPAGIGAAGVGGIAGGSAVERQAYVAGRSCWGCSRTSSAGNGDVDAALLMTG